MKEKMKRRLAQLVIGALFVGMIPTGNRIVSKANGTSISTGKAARAGYELNNPKTDSSGVVTWDCVYFGSYWQEDTNGDGTVDQEDEKQPIKWRVLSVDGDDAFLLADKNLGQKCYNNLEKDITWETCTLRSWLNGYGAEWNADGEDYRGSGFIDAAFTPAEKSAIYATNVENADNPVYGMEGGNATLDQVYLLSIDEVMNPAYGFPLDCNSTNTRKGKNDEWWWLRSPGYFGNTSAFVSTGGVVYRFGNIVHGNGIAVRPVLHLNLSSDSGWSKAGTVTSEGGEIVLPVETPGEFLGKLNNPVTDSDGNTTWDCVYFGNYWQEDTNGDGKADQEDKKQPIKWRVLSVEGDDVFLLADKNLDRQLYNKSGSGVTWETCTMRSWLNGYGAEANTGEENYSGRGFFNDAFTSEEKSFIKISNVVNDDNPVYSSEGGNDTSDRVYLLSIDEIMNPTYGFSLKKEMEAKRAGTTAYATRKGVETGGSPARYGLWWLRSPGKDSYYAVAVDTNGEVDQVGYSANGDRIAVRPALHLDAASASGWTYAGTVTSGGRKTETPQPTTTPVLSTPTASTMPEVSTSPTTKPTSTNSPDENTNQKPISSSVTPAATEPSATVTPNVKSPSAGTIQKDDKNKVLYKVITQDKTIGFYRAENTAATNIVVPSTITLDGIKYNVTAIADHAFKGCKKLKSVTVGKNVTSIGKKAFYGCGKLKSIAIKSKKLKDKSVGAKAFKGIHKKAVIKVPPKQKKAYQKWLRKKGVAKTVKMK